MPTTAATPNDVAKVQAQVTALADKVAALEAATAAALATSAEVASSILERLAAVEARPVYVPPPPAPEQPPASEPVVHAKPRVAVLDYSQDLSEARALLLAKFNGPVILGIGKDKGAARIKGHTDLIRAKNQHAFIGQYVCCTEWRKDLPATDAKYPAQAEIEANGWWLKTAAGAHTQQMAQAARYDVNPTIATKTNAHGERWPEFKARFDDGVLPAGAFDFIFQDNCNSIPRLEADWNLDGVDETPREARDAMVAGYRAYTDALKLRHGLPICGNIESKLPRTLDCPEWKGVFALGFLERMIGGASSPETWGTLGDSLKRMAETQADGVTPIFNVHAKDAAEALYGLCASMLYDGYACINMQGGTDIYANPPLWLDEYDAPIGTPTGPASQVNGVWQRPYTNGWVIVNPSKTATATANLPDFGAVTMAPRSGRILVP